jgi:tetratricopeptide (TPR) repeat protein
MSNEIKPPPALVRAELAQVLGAPLFANAASHQRLLRYLVEHWLAGDTARLKETVLAIEVFQRPAARFDPAADSIVRVEARRLRQRLARHYAAEGAGAALRFELPSGQYQPRVRAHRPLAPAPAGLGDEAGELADRGEFFLRLGHEEGCRKALARFEQAAALDPQSPRAHFGVARAWAALAGMTFAAPTPAIDHAEAAAERVLAVAPQHADALALLAGIRHRYALDWPGAQALYARALAAAPGTAFLHHQVAFSLMFVRRFDEAAAELRQARTLDPLNNSVRAHEALLALYRRDFDGAERHLRALLDLQPQALAISLLGYVHLQRGEAALALDCYRQAEALFPQLTIGAIGIAQAQALLGQRAEAQATTERLRVGRAGRYLPPYQLALVAARLGDIDGALALLTRSADERDANFVCLPVDPGLDGLRADPRFSLLERRCGLPD